MLSSDENENRPIGKVGQRKAKAEQSGKKSEKKSEPRKRKEGQPAAAKPDQLLDALQRASAPVEEQVSAPIPEPISAPTPLSEVPPTETPLPEMSPIAAAQPAEPAEAAEAALVSLQTIANAYGDYSKKSFEQTSAFVAKLACARSLDKALELQTAFAREAYETFVAESRRIRELQGELAKQRLTRLEGFMSKMTQGALNPMRKT
jgi:hypothetical protein